MNRFEDLSQEEQNWVDEYLDGTIEAEAFEALQDRMLENPQLRAVMRRYLAIDDALRNEGAPAAAGASEPWQSSNESEKKIIQFPNFVPMAIAASIAFLLGIGMMFLRPDGTITEVAEPTAQGFAVIQGLFDVEWPEGEGARDSGDSLGAEMFRLASGTAEIQFFSGATMTIEGPAELSLKSAWEATCNDGVVRLNVPPAARGFRLNSPTTKIVDLGTEFGLSVRDGEGHVEVFDGEIALKHLEEEEKIVHEGEALRLAKSSSSVELGTVAFPDVGKFGSQAEASKLGDFARWRAYRDDLAGDERLIAFYTFDREPGQTLIPNLRLPVDSNLDGAVILAEEVKGRWSGLKPALEFRRPGARVRVNLPGEFNAFTFMCWVRIDSLDRRYNALFMGDGYETGEPHWQIRDDGQLMLSVMVDDSRPNPGAPNDAGFHRVYYSPSIWEMSMSGQWMHVASVYDPAGRAVSHYVNGKQISTQEIIDKFFIEKLRIGAGEIGNWGQPFRKTPWFAIRNLNGRIDEIAIFNAALSEPEILKHYESTRATN